MSAFNSIFGFLLRMDLPYFHVPKEFNPNVFWHELSRDHRYDTNNFKGTIIQNPCILVAQRLLACGLFTREDSINMPACLNYIFHIACLEVTGLTLVHSW